MGARFRRSGLTEFAAFNLKMKSRCRLAADAAGRHITDNHKSQDPQARIEGRWKPVMAIGKSETRSIGVGS